MSKTVNIVNTPSHGDRIINENDSATDRLQAFFDEIEKFGTVEDVWDDLRFPASGDRLDSAATRYSYDFVELGVTFDDNARFDQELLGYIVQMPHAWAEGQNVKPHIHWIQTDANIPNWLIQYRNYNNGEAIPAFILEPSDAIVFPFTGSPILQISTFPEIDMTGFRISSFIDVKISRDTANGSGLFSGADPLVGGVLLKEFDIHYQLDSIGSLEEFIK